MTKTQWQAISAAKQKALLASIPPEWLIHADILPPDSQLDVSAWPETSGWFTEVELEITSSPAAVILEKTASGSWTAESVARAFCKRAAAAHQLTNCLSETLFPEAIKTAQALDTHLAATGKPLGPLHGLPISIKDNFNIAGKDSTLGFTAWVGQPATHNSILIDLLKAAGAVLYVKTNVPTAMMIAETVNNVFGRTTNPFNRLTSSGGSSGGESALIAFRGSPLGVGTDIGGSLRIPAALTGIFTLKPSFGRFPNFKTKSGLAGQESVTSVNGPMARDLRSISLWAEAVVGSQPWITDPKCLPIPWREVELKRSLKIGILWNDGMVRPTPPVRRALKETAEKLRLAGHEVVDWEPIGHAQAADILDRFFLSDGGKSVEKLLAMSDEPIRPEMERYGRAVDHGVYNLWQLHQERNTLQKDYLDRWNALGLDAILAPTAPFAAVEHSKFRHVAYTGVFNILDYSCISFPCNVAVDQAVDVPAVGETPLSKEDALVQSEYNPGVIHGMPVSLQLVGRRLEEEKVVKMCDAILQAL
ncbi:TPA_exp: General amidase GmdB [Trichophyton benhamiae CBS 112371]|uniref:amidase n=1 Tax=Arthroderma benhamiae (strain ATCC MYA-4681 / CBS 112371) TaxID=663331 RepID=D4B410_ARTBC|nr:general amidase GmdB [Trichophyton benhamiae CBS 112371]EFE29858.1 general amidase GmdB [Trichophyton benhamiae CBS 112371]DAA73110.1 TPA_exp: General amidase GmdB [Trichophyton benhamiae CBS 112371]